MQCSNYSAGSHDHAASHIGSSVLLYTAQLAAIKLMQSTYPEI